MRSVKLASVYSGGDSLCFYNWAEPDNSKPGSVTSDDVTVLHVSPVSTFSSSEHHPFIFGSYEIFVDLRSRYLDDLHVSTLCSTSKQYRCLMREFLSANDENNTSESEGVQTVKDLECLWALTELLLFEDIPGGIVLPRLIEWRQTYYSNFSHCLLVFSEETANLSSNELCTDLPIYWNTILCALLEGRIAETLKLLAKHPEFESGMFRRLCELIENMPVLKDSDGSVRAVAQFELRWQYWQEECLRRFTSSEFLSNENLHYLCGILCGDEEILNAVRCLCGSWPAFFVTRLLYSNPVALPADLLHIANFSLESFAAMDEEIQSGPIDDLLLHVLEYDVHKLIEIGSYQIPNDWFWAHFTDLLRFRDMVSETRHEASPIIPLQLHELLLSRYAESLLMSVCTTSSKQTTSSDPGTVPEVRPQIPLWPLAASYLRHCPNLGKAILENTVLHIPLDSGETATDLIALCNEWGFTEHGKTLCRVMARQAIRDGKLSEGLRWAIDGKDDIVSGRIVSMLLTSGAENPDQPLPDLDLLQSAALLDDNTDALYLNDSLAFLYRYREMQQLRQSGALSEAAEALVSAISSRCAPKQFWLRLLSDAAWFCDQGGSCYITEDYTYELLHCLQDLSISSSIQKDSEKASLNRLRDKFIHNLKRSICTPIKTSESELLKTVSPS